MGPARCFCPHDQRFLHHFPRERITTRRGIPGAAPFRLVWISPWSMRRSLSRHEPGWGPKSRSPRWPISRRQTIVPGRELFPYGFHMLSIVLFVLPFYRNVAQVTPSCQVHHSCATKFYFIPPTSPSSSYMVFHYFRLAFFK